MALSRIPLPSIALVLSSDQIFPGCGFTATKPDVEFPSRTYSSSVAHLMKTIDMRDEDGSEAVQFSFHLLDDFATNVGHDDNNDAKTIFNENRPGTSRGFDSDRSSSHKVKDRIFLIMSACRKLLHVKTTDSALRKAAQS